MDLRLDSGRYRRRTIYWHRDESYCFKFCLIMLPWLPFVVIKLSKLVCNCACLDLWEKAFALHV